MSERPDDERTTAAASATPQGLETLQLRAAIEARLFGSSSASAPARIGRFVVLERLGEGGMGTVWAAWDPLLDRRVAIKVTRRKLDRERSVARMQREARALARLDHPNVVTVHEVDLIDDHLYIAMELVRGGTLGTWCEEHPPATPGRFPALLELAIQATRGLAAVHGAGLVHRDLKPSNMLVDEHGRLCLTDFGLARFGLDGRSSVEPGEATDHEADPLEATGSLTHAGEILGTPAYMAPEQLEGRADAFADQFSLCATLWEAAYGVRPFPGPTAMARLEAIERGRAALPDPAPDVPPWFRAALRRGLANAPATRWPSVMTLLHVLERGRGRRRRRGLILAGALGITGLASWGAWLHIEPQRWCGSPTEALSPAWDSERRATMRTHHEPPVVDALDAYVDAWSSAYAPACRAYAETTTTGRKDPPLEVRSPRLECLAEAREQLDAVVDELVTHVAEDERALVRALPAIADCEGRALLNAGSTEPPRSAAAPVLARTRVLLGAGRVDAAAQALERTPARDLADDPSASAVEELHAGIDAARGDAAQAEQRATQALGLAERAGDREAALRAWLRLYDAAVAQGHDERARLFAARAASLARRGAPVSLQDAVQRATSSASR